ncbi:MAG: rhodanese-like domain-containing protein [Candidatus Nanosalina sp.]
MVEKLSNPEFMEMRNSEDFLLVNVLTRETFEQGHIPGSINIPKDEIEEEAPKRFTKSQKIVVYCASEDCPASDKAAEKLEELGFENVKDFERGLEGWKSEGHELET